MKQGNKKLRALKDHENTAGYNFACVTLRIQEYYLKQDSGNFPTRYNLTGNIEEASIFKVIPVPPDEFVTENRRNMVRLLTNKGYATFSSRWNAAHPQMTCCVVEPKCDQGNGNNCELFEIRTNAAGVHTLVSWRNNRPAYVVNTSDGVIGINVTNPEVEGPAYNQVTLMKVEAAPPVLDLTKPQLKDSNYGAFGATYPPFEDVLGRRQEPDINKAQFVVQIGDAYAMVHPYDRNAPVEVTVQYSKATRFYVETQPLLNRNGLDKTVPELSFVIRPIGTSNYLRQFPLHSNGINTATEWETWFFLTEVMSEQFSSVYDYWKLSQVNLTENNGGVIANWWVARDSTGSWESGTDRIGWQVSRPSFEKQATLRMVKYSKTMAIWKNDTREYCCSVPASSSSSSHLKRGASARTLVIDRFPKRQGQGQYAQRGLRERGLGSQAESPSGGDHELDARICGWKGEVYGNAACDAYLANWCSLSENAENPLCNQIKCCMADYQSDFSKSMCLARQLVPQSGNCDRVMRDWCANESNIDKIECSCLKTSKIIEENNKELLALQKSLTGKTKPEQTISPLPVGCFCKDAGYRTKEIIDSAKGDVCKVACFQVNNIGIGNLNSNTTEISNVCNTTTTNAYDSSTTATTNTTTNTNTSSNSDNKNNNNSNNNNNPSKIVVKPATTSSAKTETTKISSIDQNSNQDSTWSVGAIVGLSVGAVATTILGIFFIRWIIKSSSRR